MGNEPLSRWSVGLLVALGLLLPGCTRSGPPLLPPTENPPVTVARPVEREVTDYVDFQGRTDAVNSVDVRARVTGYLVKMPFREGAEVRGPEAPAPAVAGALGLVGTPAGQGPLLAVCSVYAARSEGDLLFEIDPRPYQAQLDKAMGDLYYAEAKLKLAKADNARAKNIYKMNPGAISLQDLDKYQAAEEEADAAVKASQANLEYYKLNLTFTRVTSPITGQVSRYYFTLGNLANQDTTVLTTVVSLDPVYAYFDMDERTLLRIKAAINEGKLKAPSPDSTYIPVLMGLQGEEGYPHQGTIDFVNNKIDPLTGTITVRGVFANPKPRDGVRLLSPGLFVRIRLPLGKPHPALLVADKAVGTDQGLKFLYLVDADDKVKYQRVRTGPLQPDGLRVITEGLKPDDRVIVSGLQFVRPKETVVVEEAPMPTTAPADKR